MKLSRCLLLVLVCGLFTACSPSSNNARPNDTGGMEGGGGNSYNGKPLESYIQDVTKTPAYVQKVQPLLEALRQKDVSAHRLVTVALRKSWFFIPGALTGLPNEKTGAAVPTEQVALQSFKEVWLDTKLFNKMSIDEQGKLLVHEILMGVRLLKYNSRYEQCMALTPFTKDCEGSDTRALSPTSLKPEDYADIRAAVREAWDTQIKFADDWHDLFARYNFSMSFYIFKSKSTKLEISGAELMVTLRSTIMTNNLPQFGYSEELLSAAEGDRRDVINSDGKCRFSVESNIENGSISLTSTKGETFTFKVDPNYTYRSSAGWLNDRVTYGVYLSDKHLQVPGDISNDVMFIFDINNKLTGFQTSKSTLIDDGVGHYTSQIAGTYMICLNQPSAKILR